MCLAKEGQQEHCHIRNNISTKYFPFDFATARQMMFCFQIGLLRMPKLSHQVFNRNVRSDYKFIDVNLRRNHIFDSIRVLCIAWRAFSCYYNMILISPNLVFSMLVFEVNVNLVLGPKM